MNKKDILFILLVVAFLSITIFIISKMSVKSVPYKYDSSLSSDAKIKRWLAWITPHAKKIGREYGLPWEALAAQTGWETGWGKSSLINEAWNFAGIKAVAGEPYVTKRTHEVENGQTIWKDAKFRKWNSLEEGLAGYANFFHKNKRYAKALQYPNDPYQFITEIRNAGYATSLNYISNLHGILDKYIVGHTIGEYSFTGAKILKKGDRSIDVKDLQKMMNEVARNENRAHLVIKEDGIFGDKTQGLLLSLTGFYEISIEKLKELKS